MLFHSINDLKVKVYHNVYNTGLSIGYTRKICKYKIETANLLFLSQPKTKCIQEYLQKSFVIYNKKYSFFSFNFIYS